MFENRFVEYGCAKFREPFFIQQDSKIPSNNIMLQPFTGERSHETRILFGLGDYINDLKLISNDHYGKIMNAFNLLKDTISFKIGSINGFTFNSICILRMQQMMVGTYRNFMEWFLYKMRKHIFYAKEGKSKDPTKDLINKDTRLFFKSMTSTLARTRIEPSDVYEFQSQR